MVNSRSGKILAEVGQALSKLGVKKSSSILLAASGGVDSMSLAFILDKLLKQGHFRRVEIMHVNHSLRGQDSARDEKLVMKYATKLGIHSSAFKVDTLARSVEKRIGLEEAARDIRYEIILEVVVGRKCDFVLTAHNANDQAETVLMNIVRGAGLNGIQGIPQSRILSERCTLIRPLLGVTKKDLRIFAKDNRIAFREDVSNESLDFLRNRVRHLVMPAMEKAFKGRDIYSGFKRMTQNIESISRHLDSEVELLHHSASTTSPSLFIRRKISFFDRKKLIDASESICRELLIREATKLSGQWVSIDSVHSILLNSFLKFPSNRSFILTQSIIISHDGEFISVELIESSPTAEHILSVGEKIDSPVGLLTLKKVNGWKKTKDPNIAFFSAEGLKAKRLRVRYWKAGDRIRPFGMKGKSRLVSNILNESGVKSERLKYFVPLIVLDEDPEHIIWIPGIRGAEYARLHLESETALKLKRIIV